jgi:hypothetical protein
MHCFASASFSTQKLTNDKYESIYCSFKKKRIVHASILDYFLHDLSVLVNIELSLILFIIFYLVDAAAADNNARISPENNIDFYAYSQAAPYSVIFAIFIFIYFLI